MLKWRNICGEILVRLIYVVYFCRKYTKIVVGQGLMSCTNQSEHLLIKIESFFYEENGIRKSRHRGVKSLYG